MRCDSLFFVHVVHEILPKQAEYQQFLQHHLRGFELSESIENIRPTCYVGDVATVILNQ
jgi:hypothetical protein